MGAGFAVGALSRFRNRLRSSGASDPEWKVWRISTDSRDARCLCFGIFILRDLRCAASRSGGGLVPSSWSSSPCRSTLPVEAAYVARAGLHSSGEPPGLLGAKVRHCSSFLACIPHSFLSATIGSTPAARRAGTTDATTAARMSSPVATASMTGFHGSTPKS